MALMVKLVSLNGGVVVDGVDSNPYGAQLVLLFFLNYTLLVFNLVK